MPDDAPLVTIYTDGACARNPGPGGYAAVLLCGGQRRELSGGARLTTNNRMELLAVVAALESLAWPARVTVFSDARYVVDAFPKGYPTRPGVANADLWGRLLDQCDRHKVRFEWVRGHAGDPENERCDELATAAARAAGLPADAGYERAQAAAKARAAAQPSLFD